MSERLPKQALGPQDNVTQAIGLHAAAGNDDAVRVADAARPRGPEVGDAEREAPLRSGVVADPEVHDVDVVDDLAAFLLALVLFLGAHEMTARALVPPTHRHLPFVRSGVSVFCHAKHGRVHAGGHSALGPGVAGGTEQEACQGQPGGNQNSRRGEQWGTHGMFSPSDVEPSADEDHVNLLKCLPRTVTVYQKSTSSEK